MPNTYIEAKGAYGRDYVNQAQIKAAWKDGKDFQVTEGAAQGRYVNKADADAQGLKVIIRYDSLKKVVAVN